MAKQIRDKLLDEIKNGGTEAPCPRCGLPRVKRSDYIRCCLDGINWLEGEALDEDPRMARQRRLVEQTEAAQGKSKKEPHGER